jgi:hypothetical protein
MIRLSAPAPTFSESIDACVQGILGNPRLRDRALASKVHLLPAEEVYAAAGSNGDLSLIPVAEEDEPNRIALAGTLRKSDLITLYDTYFVPRGKPGRAVYSQLLNAAREECPFCGGIGTPQTLDHFLPKAKHPVFSVLPINLVPSCRDCNLGEKGQRLAASAEEVFLQPYVDKDVFFDDQWIFATYLEDAPHEPGRFAYFVQAPDGWDPIDASRAGNHFATFGLAHKYGLRAAQALTTVMAQVQMLIGHGLTLQDVNKTVLQPGIESAPFANHWQKGMYQALSRTLSVPR